MTEMVLYSKVVFVIVFAIHFRAVKFKRLLKRDERLNIDFKYSSVDNQQFKDSDKNTIAEEIDTVLDNVFLLNSNKFRKQVMISYQWDNQTTMTRLASLLEDSGLKVWMDIYKMEGSILGSMANGIEESNVVLIGLSKKYKESANCRTEAEYAYKLKKPIVPLLLEKNYEPDGWLGALLGMKLYVDISEYNIDEKFPDIFNQINVHTKLDMKKQEKLRSEELPKCYENKNSYEHWSEERVQNWAKNTEIDGLPDSLLGFDGASLKVLFDSYNRMKNFSHRTVIEDLKLSLQSAIKLIKEKKRMENEQNL